MASPVFYVILVTQIKDMVELFSTLEMLGKTIEPTTLRSFVEAHVRRAIEFGLCKLTYIYFLHANKILAISLSQRGPSWYIT